MYFLKYFCFEDDGGAVFNHHVYPVIYFVKRMFENNCLLARYDIMIYYTKTSPQGLKMFLFPLDLRVQISPLTRFSDPLFLVNPPLVVPWFLLKKRY